MVSEEQNSKMELASEVIPVPQVIPKVENINNEEIKHVNNDLVNINSKEDVSRQAKNSRQRKKAICAAICKQMEFYFSDSNLSKDRFLAALVKENSDVDLDVFLRFNRIKNLTTDINLIVKALSKSTMLKVSEDGTKVRRITPVVEKQNIDECTVYIQGLPSDADHDWLTNLFSEYGPIAYVSIPKFKYNNKIKGFAFIEFDTPEGAEKCLKAFRAKGCELPSQTAPTDVLSITTFNEEEKEEKICSGNLKKTKENQTKKLKEDEELSESADIKAKKRKKTKSTKFYDKDSESDLPENMKQVENEKEEQSGIENNTEKEKSEGKSKIRKRKKKNIDHKDDEYSENSQTEVKKIKLENVVEATLNCSDSNLEEEKRGKKRNNRTSSESLQETEIDIESTKKKRKIESEEIIEDEKNIDIKKDNSNMIVKCANENEVEKKKKKKRKRNHHPQEMLKAANLGMQVMGKKSWKKLRNKYLDLQKAKMKQLKLHMRNARWNQWGERNKIECEYEEIPVTRKENASSNLEFVPGLIVKVELHEACVDPKGFKAEMRNHSGKIKYVDIKEGSNIAFVRCESSEAAAVLAEETNNERRFKVLKDEEEKAYWDKIVQDRKEKIDNKIRTKHRGRDKLLKKAEKELGKHIKFDEV